ncbi:uncharacterized protein LOC128745769 [Sabethes cyaneus]|uniref:uncharacterized protein LOC128745769 n=1 Tax=Sabethes cyaneus TaxID=53552 RepID=UPI00237E50E8|nr:uncharacterized protein LOC128745769 [Sabethes cyaneus]
MADQQLERQLRSRRSTLLASLSRAEAFDADFDVQRDQTQVTLRLQYLSGIWDNLEAVQAQLEDIEASPEGQAEHAAARADFESRLFTIKASLISKLPSVPASQSPQPSRSSSTLSGIKLPTISLPEFDGDYKQWLAFHGTFLALIHSNSEVPDIQKFHYLRAAALFDIPCMKKESATTLHGLVDEFERYVKILHQLGEPTGSWGTILEHLLCTRLHDSTLREWENHASTVENPDYTCLIDFLQRRTRVLDSISVNHNHASNPASVTPANTSKRPFHSQYRLSSYSSTANSVGSKPTERCGVCGQPHMAIKCPKFNQLTFGERQQLVQSKRLCHNCLKTGHMVRNCLSNSSCHKCNRRHHTLLHSTQGDGSRRTIEATASSSTLPENSQPDELTAATASAQSSVPATENVPEVEVSSAVQHPRENVFLLTVIVKVIDAFGHTHLARALLDSASQPNLITDRMAQILRLRRDRVNVTVQGAGKLCKPVRESVFAQIHSRRDDFSCGVSFLVMDKVTANLPSQDISTTGWKIPKGLFLADPSFNKSQPIDMVLGARHFYSFFPSSARIQLDKNLPLLVDSVFGWTIVGSASPVLSSPVSSSAVCNTVLVSNISLEGNYSVEETQCETLYQATVSRNPEGRYFVRYPKKPDFESILGESKPAAMRRFELLERRLQRNPLLKDDYHQFMREYLSLGHMQLIKEDEEHNSRANYLPHHPVIKEASSTTKVRVVFDGSPSQKLLPVSRSMKLFA